MRRVSSLGDAGVRTRISWVGEGREKLSSGARFECAGGCGKSGDAGWAREWVDVPQNRKWTRPRRIEKSAFRLPFGHVPSSVSGCWLVESNWAEPHCTYEPYYPTWRELSSLPTLPRCLTVSNYPPRYIIGKTGSTKVAAVCTCRKNSQATPALAKKRQRLKARTAKPCFLLPSSSLPAKTQLDLLT